jgi:hypothetical protein
MADDHGLRAVAHAELGEHVSDMGLDGRLGDDELLRDLGVGAPRAHVREHLALERAARSGISAGSGGRRAR